MIDLGDRIRMPNCSGKMSFFESFAPFGGSGMEPYGLGHAKQVLPACHTPSQRRKKKISFTGVVLECERWNTRGHQMSIDSREESCC